ncbi:SlyX family protein [Gilvimarinus xylanilyticus]|uniref:SlyX family protein n=1 Tax=Gilvimarinus xylanilyticus TaxID=2944139 RepID=A0A9X2I3E0_9GAMM|nr:SlyX family protein [Gilvimarinus xylanilyticus]MCP8898762.1 SlyX family protein [Gilvimarinus xylanilyticus]
MSSEIEDLQSRLAFQEDTLNELNSIVARQDRQLTELTDAYARLAQKLDDMAYEREQGVAAPANERPPHY